MTSPLFVERHPGTGRPVVFLHGLASQGAQDWPEAEWGGSFGDRPRVVVDLPAHGASPTLGTAPTSVVLDALADAVGADEIDLVGYSLGPGSPGTWCGIPRSRCAGQCSADSARGSPSPWSTSRSRARPSPAAPPRRIHSRE